MQTKFFNWTIYISNSFFLSLFLFSMFHWTVLWLIRSLTFFNEVPKVWTNSECTASPLDVLKGKLALQGCWQCSVNHWRYHWRTLITQYNKLLFIQDSTEFVSAPLPCPPHFINLAVLNVRQHRPEIQDACCVHEIIGTSTEKIMWSYIV